MAAKVVRVTRHGSTKSTYSFDKLNAQAKLKRKACLRGLVATGLQESGKVSEKVAKAIGCNRCTDKKRHAWQDGAKLDSCKVGAKAAPAADADGPTKEKDKVAKRPKPAEGADTESDAAGDTGASESEAAGEEAAQEADAAASGAEKSPKKSAHKQVRFRRQ